MVKLSLDKAAKKFLEKHVKLKKGERVLVVTDRKNCQIFKAICHTVELKGGNLKKVKIKRKREHSSPLPYLKEVFAKSNVKLVLLIKAFHIALK
ncbi:MAG: hypothetical protein ACP5O8_02380 [Candidatus Aenigmatarchaeota archaeon]